MLTESLHPTLWRTCRVLASDTRLRLFTLLARRQPQSVSELAEQCALTLPVASQSLRALEARGLLKVRRVRRRVEYCLPAPVEAVAQAMLIAALKTALRTDSTMAVQVIRLATAFTHPARIGIYRALQTGPKNFAQLQAIIRLSPRALARHLEKLLKRGFVSFEERTGIFTSLNHPSPVGLALGKLAVA